MARGRRAGTGRRPARAAARLGDRARPERRRPPAGPAAERRSADSRARPSPTTKKENRGSRASSSRPTRRSARPRAASSSSAPTAATRWVSGSGWVVRPGIVVTNAHVVAGSEALRAQLPGSDKVVPATTIWFDPVHDIAIVRAAGLRRLPALELAEQAQAGTQAAILGYPGGGPYDVQFARLGGTAMIPAGSALIGEESGKRQSIPSTALLGKSRPGNSGGPVVDGDGRVLGMIYGGEQRTGQPRRPAGGDPHRDARLGRDLRRRARGTGRALQEAVAAVRPRVRAARRTRCAASAGTCRRARRDAARSPPRRAARRSARASSGCTRCRRSAAGRPR